MAEIAAGPAKGKMIEIWYQDEARIGQKNKITRRWAKRGSRPSAPHDQRTRSAYIFGAICPRHGKAAALVMPWCDTHAMTQHLAEIARHVDEDAHAILIMDQAGWHMTKRLVVHAGITLRRCQLDRPNSTRSILRRARDGDVRQFMRELAQ